MLSACAYVKLTVLALCLSAMGWLCQHPAAVDAQAAPPDDRARADFFESRIRPLLANNCFTCHADAAKGGLRLDSRAALLQGGGRGPAIVPGNPEESLLIKTVSYTHETLRMPKGAPKLRLDEINELIKWVKDGAYWPETAAEFFAARIKPLLDNKCIACHNDAAQGGLRLDSRAAMLKGGKRGPAVVPGAPEQSLLIQAVHFTDNTMQMPPAGKLSQPEIADLIKWVKDGALWAEAKTATHAAYVITPEQRAFWAFQPLQNAAAPPVKTKRWARNQIDNFILAKLEAKGLQPLATADKRTLLRRATFDLTGLPPTPKEVETFLQDNSPNAFAKVIDRLLASPHYGERWGRHWLDVVRYADSAGDSADYPIPQAYLYRNYVIDAFNRDKPYDQFLKEQIAGDLLPHKDAAEKWEHTVATGYLALARRFSVRPENYMHLTIEDTIDNLGKTVLGLTVNCARCHDHKYDPISAQDYYALYGIFASTRYPFAGSENDQYQKDLVTRLPKEDVDKILKPYTDQIEPLNAELERLKQERSALVRAGKEAAETSDPNAGARTTKQIDAEMNKLRKQRRELLQQMPQVEKAFAVTEGKPHHAKLQIRGEPRNPGAEVPRRFLQILGGQTLQHGDKQSGRLELAEWLTQANNPLTARVMVNRIWQYHFGKGLINTPSDFGLRGQRPTHPELLDYLAAEFIKSGWSIKAMHRMMMLSQTYQLASSEERGGEGGKGRAGDKKGIFAANAALDVGNDYLWRFNARRLDAESIRDSMLFVSGELDKTVGGGGHQFPHEATWSYTQHRPFIAVYESKRRSVYLMTQRIQKQPYLATFDGADTNASSPLRAVTTTPLQALFMMNSQFVHEQADSFAKHLLQAHAATRAQIQSAYRHALSRSPSTDELQKGEEYLRLSNEKLTAAGITAEARAQKALASYLRALLGSSEFIFVD